ncbi:leucine-rich repeat receptor-like serine/threonine-protein kinase [Corchorus olitorius]|uniref:Leucine-rich repeat receptor-like serine/threonine-protein kinase n=1 Tax=Corchorus olitorius TaxID=93759 RepID=A0A1R3ICS3_9ROSI|nr:leucine-rich repeat receptor-like serine/threonine-protein kinase [Corchorus olitorius]
MGGKPRAADGQKDLASEGAGLRVVHGSHAAVQHDEIELTPRKDSVPLQQPGLDDSPLPPHTPRSLVVDRGHFVEQDSQSVEGREVGKGKGKRLKTWFDS